MGKYFPEVIVVTPDRQVAEFNADIPWQVEGDDWLQKIKKKRRKIIF
ncbi:hypothetical protein LptCag_0254 [Leptospirillum ferriphilum]|uniref:Uncharacterized protein n=1 Tax=Leptospirillum ferriphilum TaxID=178606 RepID=A0A094W6W8_9BACT|nr:hypothetical protein LptCag_0254 [Leptospirillum ferriphilum]